MMIVRALVSSLFVCVCGPVLAQQANQADARQAAMQFAHAFADAYNGGNPADIAALFTSDGIYLTPGGTFLTTHQDITAGIAARQKAGWTKETVTVVEARPEGSDVLAIVDYELQGTGTVAGKQIGGYAADLLTKDGSGWRAKMIAGNLKPVQDVTGMAMAK
jgi:ketosteroid isomerase-like protein